ncbi:hypothetical protein HUJ05_003858 [Dendroctonus ponderosae]|nr:hypothetical protein HUJ05_003858 [Dendroctonus ponderosae]
MYSVALALSIGLVAVSWIDFLANPVITYPYSPHFKNADFHFPAVTICSFNKISKRAAYDMAQKLNIYNSSTVEQIAQSLKLLALLTDSKEHILPKEQYDLLRKVLRLSRKNEHEIFEQIAPSCNKVLKKCMWQHNPVNCTIIFRTIKSPIGFCCSFQFYVLKNTVSTFDSKSFVKNSGCIFQTGLEVVLDNDANDYFASNVPSIGFQVQLHNRLEFPHFELTSTLHEMNTNSFISVDAELLGYSTVSFPSMAISKRKCLIEVEREMERFTIYTYQNCITECKVKIIKKLCGCVPFYFRKSAGPYQVPCTVKDQLCVARNQDRIFSMFYETKRIPEGVATCKCSPNCAGTTYQQHHFKGPLDWTSFKNPDSIEFKENLENVTVIRVFFRSLRMKTIVRNIKMSGLAFLGLLAGVVGLIAAPNFTTVFECMYLCGIGLSTFNRTRNKYFSVEKLAHNLKLLARLTDNKYRVLPRKEYNFLTAVLKENQIDEHEVFEQIAPSCTRLLKKCIWKQKLVNCSSIFQTTKTPIGFCCSFSYYALKILKPSKKGHARHFLRNPGCIFQTGLEVLLDNDPTDYFKSDIPSVGFQVQLHNPFDFPHFALPSILGEINTNNFISVNAEFTSTTEAVELMAASARNCLFMKERRMKYFNRYNYQNCITECKVATIYEFCGCIPFYLREKTGKSAHFHKPCTIKDQSCIARNQDTIFDIFHNRPSAGISTAKCKCYPNCAYMTYQSHISKGPLDLAYFTKRDSIEFGQNLENSTVIRVFMSSLASNGNRRDVKFSNIGLLDYSHIPCTIKDQNCIASNQDIIFDINRQRPHDGESNNKCKCYPNCGYITYQSYISKGPLDWSYFKNPHSIE